MSRCRYPFFLRLKVNTDGLQTIGNVTVLKTMLCTVVPRYLEMARREQDRTVAMAAVDSLHELLEQLGTPVLQVTGATDDILATMKEIFTHKVIQKHSLHVSFMFTCC